MTDAAHVVPSWTPPSVDPSIFAALPHDIQTELRAMHHVREAAPPPVYTISAPPPWVCHVCTFLNHPELVECEMCGTLGCLSPDVGSPSSRLGRTWRKLRLPASPVSLPFSQRRDPGAEDLLAAATTTLQLVKDSWTGRRSRTNSASGDKPMLVPTPQTCLELLELETDLSHKVVAGDAWFESSLERLWRVVGGRTEHETYDRKRVDWVKLGFQNASPETDFRGGGRLAMKCLLYAFEAHPMEMRTIHYDQMPDGNESKRAKRWYPVCVAGINLTCLLAGLLQLGDGKFAEKKEVFWHLFEEPAAFYELYFLAFVKMNAIWHRLNATYMEFGVVLKATQKIVTFILEQGPATLVELREVSDQALVERFGASLSTRSLTDWEGQERSDSFQTLEMEDTLVIAKTRPTSKSEPSIKGNLFWPLC